MASEGAGAEDPGAVDGRPDRCTTGAHVAGAHSAPPPCSPRLLRFAWRRLDHAPLGGLDELEQVVDLLVTAELVADARDRLAGVEPRREQSLHRLPQAAARLRLHPLAPEPDRVEAVAGRLLADGLDVRQGVHGEHRVAADVGVAADPGELVHGAEGADRGVVVHGDVAGEGRVVGEHAAVADVAVVGHVAVRHEQVVGADRRHAAAEPGAPVDGRELAEVVAVADLEPARLASELEVLGLEADAGVREDPVVAADDGVGAEHLGAGADLRAGADPDTGADHRVGADPDVGRQLGGGIDDGRRMDRVAHRLTDPPSRTRPPPRRPPCRRPAPCTRACSGSGAGGAPRPRSAPGRRAPPAGGSGPSRCP